MKVYKALIACCVAGALGSPQQAAAGDKTMKLSLSEALTMARENNYTIKAARSKVDQAEARIVQSRQSYLPKVTLSETFVVTNDPGAALVLKLQQNSVQQSDFMPEKLNNADIINDFNTSIQVMQPVYNADAAIGRKMAFTAKTAQEHMTARTEESIGLQVTRVYYGLILARKNIDAIEQSIRTMQAHSNEAARGFSAGLLPKSDKLSTDVRLSELLEQKMMMHDEIKNATDALKVMLRLDSGVTIVPTGDLVIDRVLPSSSDKAVSENRSDLKAYETYQQVARLQEEMIRASKRPRLNAFLQTNLHSDNIFSGGSSWALGMNMQWTIFDGMATAGRIQEAKAQEREAMYNYEAAKSGSIAEVEKSMRSLKTSRARIAVAQKSLEEARVSLDYISSQFKTGMAMTFELLMREQAHTYAKMRLNQAKFDYCMAKSELAYYRGN
ncbi:TolC family protein [Chlorobium sp. BLA1]|uniref:TolC family protein n=1 Tax=Candidatus Chlorobium masyuteum TaxID=2716876 RepID=UPI00141F4BF3|nr:TolC family protein [Candidatus Chlorobium masyuteum]NHQ61149.1 TolC family protein [Candidatus Chlorobium masyuteum]NTU45301.1 TolC family protein [Chlorobiaceae bacterium]